MNTNSCFLSFGAKTILLSLSLTTLLAAVPSVRAQSSASDLMEQGVYSEETKGDLSGAVQLYQKVIAQATEDRALAARAQYHLGVCYYKQSDFNDADAAFKSVVKNYPDQKDIVSLARKYLAGAHPLGPVPWTDGEEVRLDLDLASGLNIGMMVYRVDAGVTTNGQKTWICHSQTYASPMVMAASRSEVDADTFTPIHCSWRHTLLGKADVTYYSDHADIVMEGKAGTNVIQFDSPVIDNEEAVEWMRRLPMTNGFSVDQTVLSGLASMVVPLKMTVTGPEQVVAPAGTFQCWKVALSINQTFWYSADANRYLVRFEGGGAVGELKSISHHSPNEIPSYTDPTNGFSLTGPAGWIIAAGSSEKTNTSQVHVLDPEALASIEITVSPTETGTPTNETSLRSYVTNKLASTAKLYGVFQPRTNSWQARTVGGQPGISVIADFVESKAKKTAYGVWSFGKTNEIYLQMVTSQKDFGAFQPKFDALVDSYAQ